MKDSDLRKCSPAARGVWIDLLCMIHDADDLGSITGTLDQLARMIGVFPAEMRQSLDELSDTTAATVTERNGKITVVCNRIQREAKLKQGNALRQRRHRGHTESNKNVTPPSSSSSSSSTSTTTKAVVEETRESAPKPPPQPPPETRAESIYREYFPDVRLAIGQADAFHLIDDLDEAMWRKTCGIWQGNGHNVRHVGNIVDRYKRELKLQKEHTNGTSNRKKSDDEIIAESAEWLAEYEREYNARNGTGDLQRDQPVA